MRSAARTGCRRLAALWLATHLLSACGGDGSPTAPAVSANTILFTHSLNPGTEIAAVSDTGGPETPLSDLPGEPYAPVVSPDRRWVAFNYYMQGHMEGVHVMRADGSGVRAVPGTTEFEVTDWSREGMLIRNVPRRSEHRYYLAQLDGGEWTPLAAFDDAEWLALSPDGTRVAYSAPADSGLNIFFADRDGSHVRKVTGGAFADQVPSWSPDGKSVAFVSTRDVWGSLWIAAADSPQLRRVDTLVVSGRPRWSPGGDRIVFASTVSQRTGENDIFIVNPDGSGLLNLTEGLGQFESDPVWVGD